MIIIPRFTPRQLLFGRLSSEKRLEFLSYSEPLQEGVLHEMPELPKKLSHLACVMVAIEDSSQPVLMYVCPTWEDVCIIQETSIFNNPKVTTTWFAIGEWNAI